MIMIMIMIMIMMMVMMMVMIMMTMRRMEKCLAALTRDSDSPQPPTLGILAEGYLCPLSWW